MNIGIAAGPSGLVVIDCDNGKPWPAAYPQPKGVNDGADMLMLLADMHAKELWHTPIVATPSGGLHFYFRAPSDHPVGNSAGTVGPWIDVRANGGYIVAPYSSLPHGHYRPLSGWHDTLVADGSIEVDQLELTNPRLTEVTFDPMPLPLWLASLAVPSKTEPPSIDPLDRLSRALDRGVTTSTDSYGSAALLGELDAIRQAAQGTRNDTLNRGAYKLGGLISAGLLDETLVIQELTEAARSTGLEEMEINRTITSGLRAGMRSPRQIA